MRTSASLRPQVLATLTITLLLVALLHAAAAVAQPVTIYRCTDAAGELTIQSKPCPAGSRQREQQLPGVPSSPDSGPRPASAPPSAAAPASPSAPVDTATPIILSPPPALPAPQPGAGREFVTTSTGPAPRILDSANLPRDRPTAAKPDPGSPPPPPLFRCATYDNDSYLSEEQQVPPRCLPLRTVGLDGNPAAGAGRACEVVRDVCSRVPDGAACDAWRRYAREAESRWRFAHPDNAERRRIEYERLASIVTTSCGSP